MLKHLNHPNIVQYKASYYDKGELIIIMEFCGSKLVQLITIA